MAGRLDRRPVLLDDGADEAVAVAEVVLERGGVALSGRGVDLAQRHRLDAPRREQHLGRVDQLSSGRLGVWRHDHTRLAFHAFALDHATARGIRHGHRLHPRTRARGDPQPGPRLRRGRHQAGHRALRPRATTWSASSAATTSAPLGLRGKAREAGLWLPHMPEEWGGMGLGHVALAMVQAEAAKARVGPWVLNCMAPDEGNMHTLLHWAHRGAEGEVPQPLCDGVASSCFAMTEPEVAGSRPDADPDQRGTRRRRVGDQRAQVVHLQRRRAPSSPSSSPRTELDVPDGSRGGQHRVHRRPAGRRAGTTCARSRPCTVPAATARSSSRTCASTTRQILGGRGNGHLLGQYRLGPARLAHCMRWIAQAETALDMMVDRSLNRYSHGSACSPRSRASSG